MSELAKAIEQVLIGAGRPMTSDEIASELGQPPREIDRVIWADSHRFAWQPGNRWAVAREKGSPKLGPTPLSEARGDEYLKEVGVPFHATMLSSGVSLRASHRPLDGDAIFSVKSSGSTLEIVFNSTHPIFDDHPFPFSETTSEDGFKELVEILLAGWAVYEDGMGSDSKRKFEDTRLLWGRRVGEILRDAEQPT